MSKLLACPNVKLSNAVAAEDLIIKEGRVAGVVTNWALVTMNHNTQSCMDPNVMESKVVVSSCGHDGPMGATGVKRLRSVGMIESVSEMKALDMNSVEDVIIRLTREIILGMIVTEMEVVEIDGSSRMFGYEVVMVVVEECAEGSKVHCRRRVENVVVGRKRYGGVIMVKEIE
nr:thiamine thiazole synthase, chloroplastic-like [Tanacetum cinerariifolium]